MFGNRPTSAASLPVMVKESEAASFLGVEAKKLRRLCYEKRGPKSIKFGRDRLYPREALLEWIAERER